MRQIHIEPMKKVYSNYTGLDQTRPDQ